MLPPQAASGEMVPRFVNQELPKLGRTAGELMPLLPEIAPGMGYMAEAFVKAFVERVFQRMVGIGVGLAGGSAPSPSGTPGTPQRDQGMPRTGTTPAAAVGLGFSTANLSSEPETRRRQAAPSMGSNSPPQGSKFWGN